MTRAIEVSADIEAIRDALSRYDSCALGDLFTLRQLRADVWRVRGLHADVSALAIELQSQGVKIA